MAFLNIYGDVTLARIPDLQLVLVEAQADASKLRLPFQEGGARLIGLGRKDSIISVGKRLIAFSRHGLKGLCQAHRKGEAAKRVTLGNAPVRGKQSPRSTSRMHHRLGGAMEPRELRSGQERMGCL